MIFNATIPLKVLWEYDKMHDFWVLIVGALMLPSENMTSQNGPGNLEADKQTTSHFDLFRFIYIQEPILGL